MSAPTTPMPSRAFVLGLADRAGVLDGSALYDLAEAVGFSRTSIRLVVRRLVEAGLMTSDGRGRTALLHLTATGLEERAPDLAWIAFAYRRDTRPDPWDGRWHLATFEVPETQRSARDAVRHQLVDLLGAPLSAGLYVSPHEWEPWVDETARLHGIRENVTTFTTTELRVGVDDDQRLVAGRLWPLAELHAEAESFVDRWGPVARAVSGDQATAAAAAFEASVQFERWARRDPVLPSPLEPDGWQGPTVRSVYRDLLAGLADRHPLIGQAGVFRAFDSVIDETSAMSDEHFATWLWSASRPR